MERIMNGENNEWREYAWGVLHAAWLFVGSVFMHGALKEVVISDTCKKIRFNINYKESFRAS